MRPQDYSVYFRSGAQDLIFQTMVLVNLLFTALIHNSTDCQSQFLLGTLILNLTGSICCLVGGNVPSIFPTCSVGEGNLITNKFLVVLPIWTIAFETSELVTFPWSKM